MILKGYNFDGRCLPPMLGKQPYYPLLHFKEARRMQMAKPETISQQPEAREVIVSECMVIGRVDPADPGWD